MPTTSKPLIYLASASPRRSALLTQIGVPHRIRAVDIDEQSFAESPRSYVARLARIKAQTLWDRLPADERLPVLGADTTVALSDGQSDGTSADILGKPRDREDGVRMLERLSQQTHQVLTAVALRHDGGCDLRLSVSDVTFRALTVAEIAAYWETGELIDKAGGYAVQGMAAIFIERITGSYSGIMGLPLYETAELLQLAGWRMTSPSAAADSRIARAGGAQG